MYVHNDFDGVLDYLEQSNVASTSTLTPIMLDLWQEAQWRRSSSERQGVNTLEKVDVLRKFHHLQILISRYNIRQGLSAEIMSDILNANRKLESLVHAEECIACSVDKRNKL